MNNFERRGLLLDNLHEKISKANKYAKDNPLSKGQLIAAINKAKNRSDLDLLRSLVVESRDSKVLQLWQEKWWKK